MWARHVSQPEIEFDGPVNNGRAREYRHGVTQRAWPHHVLGPIAMTVIFPGIQH